MSCDHINRLSAYFCHILVNANHLNNSWHKHISQALSNVSLNIRNVEVEQSIQLSIHLMYLYDKKKKNIMNNNIIIIAPICILIMCSGGNAGMAAAHVARRMGIPATIVFPSSSPPLVVQKLWDQGATVRIVGKVTLGRALVAAHAL